MKTTKPGLVRFTTLLAALLATLAGCESTKLAEPSRAVPIETRSPVTAGSGSSAGTAGAAPQSQVATVDLNRAGAAGNATGATAPMPTRRVVYFDFDSFAVKGEDEPVLEGYGKVLSTARAKRMTIEGHTDERGGREYNLALGQKRAEAVVKSLRLLGAGDAQLEAVSFGEERPAATGSDESAWAKNRRAELKDR